MPKFILIIGPQAVGKMTVGQELAKMTGYKLFYNHMTIEMVRLIFDYDKKAYQRMNYNVWELLNLLVMSTICQRKNINVWR